MKRSAPLQRRTPLVARTGLQRRTPLQRATPADRAPMSGKRSADQGKDARWREKVYALRGRWCRACGGDRDVQVDHMVPRSPATRWAIEDGLPLCGDFGRGRCHPRKTAHQLKIQRDWLDPDQIAWLDTMGYAVWQSDGTVTGSHCRLFAPVDN